MCKVLPDKRQIWMLFAVCWSLHHNENFSVTRQLERSKNSVIFRLSRKRSRGSAKKELNLTSILVCIVVVFLVCNIPRVFINCYEFLCSENIVRWASIQFELNVNCEIAGTTKRCLHLCGSSASPASTTWLSCSTPRWTSSSTSPAATPSSRHSSSWSGCCPTCPALPCPPIPAKALWT